MKKLIILFIPLFLLCGFTHAKNPQLARSVWFLFEQQENATRQPNDSVVVSYKTVSKYLYPNDPAYEKWPRPYIIVNIQNQTERVVYVDLQKSFFVINEELYPLYIASSEVQTKSNTSMVGVNLGLIGVGSAGTTANTKIIHAERFITVPGETKKSIEIPLTKWNVPFNLNNVDAKLELKPGGQNEITDPQHREFIPPYLSIIQYFINSGEVKNYEKDDSPMTLDLRLCYSFEENMTPNYTNRLVYYTKYIIGADYRKGGRFDNKAATERALETFPSLNDYLTSSKKLYFQIWSPEFMPKK